MSKVKHVYGAINFTISSVYKQERTLPNCLNWFGRHFDKAKKELIEPMLKSDFKDEKRRFGIAVLRVYTYIFISAKSSAKSFKDFVSFIETLLADKDKEALLKLKETGKKGGITPFRLGQIAYAIANIAVKDKGDGFAIKDLGKTDTDIQKTLASIAHDYHKKRAKKRKNKQVTEKVTETAETVEQVDVNSLEIVEVAEMLENGSVKTTDLTDTEQITELKQLVDKRFKGALTRREKQLI